MRDDILLKLGQKIRYERIRRNLSQEDLAELVGLSKQSIGAIENGSSNVMFTNLYKIAKALGLNLGDFSDFKL